LTPTRIAIATDAWHPQVNGVVTTLERTAAELGGLGFEVLVLNPGLFRTVPCPSYPSIRLAFAPRRVVAEHLSEFVPHAVHIATEGPIGHAVRRYCLRAGLCFTSSYHTQFPEYLRLRWPVPVDWTYAYLRRFHGSARSTLVPTVSFRKRLVAHGFRNVVVWARGVDTGLFHPRDKGFLDAPRPIAMYVGRIAIEKNVEAFLSLGSAGQQVRGRRRAGPRDTRPSLSRGALRRVPAWRGHRRLPGRGRCLRVPEPHRYLRAGVAGGHGPRASR